jgi:hypothetical protein
MSSRFLLVAIWLLGATLACASGSERGSGETDGGLSTGNGSQSTSESGSSTGETSSSDGEASDDDDDDGIDESSAEEDNTLKFDLVSPDLPEELPVGCEKVDFLFIVDNSSSMGDEQDHLTTSFPGFIAGIRETIRAKDYQLMVVDTDGVAPTQMSTCTASGECTCSDAPFCCAKLCEAGNATCNGETCAEINNQHACELDFGVGMRYGSSGDDCKFATQNRYLLADQPGLEDAFACAAKRGVGGAREEKPMDAMRAALSPEMIAANACNAGFLRDDAILVVTLITDEEDDVDDNGSTDGPQEWFQALVAAKLGNAAAVVLIGFVGDTGLPGALCKPLSGTDGAERSPRLHEFIANAGDLGLASSVCADDFAPAFAEAIAKIDKACDDFIPPK